MYSVMYLPKKLVVAAAIITLALTLPVAAEDLTIVERDGSKTSTLYISSDMVKQSYPDQDAIYDLANRTYTHIFHERKEYFVATEKQMRDAGEYFRQNIEGRVRSIFEANKLPTKKNMLPTLSFSVEKGTDRKKIAGYDCEQYLIRGRSGQVDEEWWIAPTLASPPHYEMRKIAAAIDPDMVRVIDEMKDNGVRLGEIVRRPAGVSRNKDLPEDRSKEAVEVKKGPIDPSLFRVSVDGYREIESPYAKLAKFGVERK
jgi:hypothetical protein